jgi:hypothetical protein
MKKAKSIAKDPKDVSDEVRHWPPTKHIPKFWVTRLLSKQRAISNAQTDQA